MAAEQPEGDAGAAPREQAGRQVEDDASNGLEFARQFGMHYPSVMDPDGTVMPSFSPGPPVTLLLDSTGKVNVVQRGEIKDSASLRRLVQRHLAVLIPGALGR